MARLLNVPNIREVTSFPETCTGSLPEQRR
ncbi:hypothetical protein OG884_33825 [Streptosporangium sp. NBC_01755]|nr:hypothetical protein [Streptosporangium sp. NBC_01755]WSC99727.1 hypothetical protein OG884_33825 [Streptosporangium sp. NBC_01755]